MSTELEAYESYVGFLTAAIKSYWDSKSRSKLDLVALLLATREAWNVAIDDATAPGTGKSWLKGAAGVAAVTLLLRTILGGPLGILLTGVSVASLAAMYAKHHEQIWTQVDHYRRTVDDFRPKFEKIITGYAAKSLDQEQRDLMIDGLIMRFVKRLEEIPVIRPDDTSSEKP